MKMFSMAKKAAALLTIICFFGVMELAVLAGPVQAAGRDAAVQSPAGDEAPAVVVKESASRRPGKKERSLLPWIVAGGVVLAAVLILVLAKKKNGDSITIDEFGEHGSGDGQFNDPSGIALDADGNVYVSDYSNERIQKFTANGAFIKKWSLPQGMHPMGLTVHGDRLYVCDVKNFSNIHVFDLEGNHQATWRVPDYNNRQGAVAAVDVDTDSAGNIYVVDNINVDVVVFNSSGNVKGHFSTEATRDIPRCLGITISGEQIFLTDGAYNMVNAFDLNGKFIRTWGESGSTPGKFYVPTGIAVMKGNSLIVGDINNSPTFARIQKFNFSGEFQGVIQPGQGGFYAKALAVNDQAGKIYICYGTGDKILVVDTF
ncbi:MAG: hypothetical protein MUC72_07655 [Acidobacteria bacterium]|jgi:hypothetical protein|nr:hypothetical protein [Acidobacteriota bacterium]